MTTETTFVAAPTLDDFGARLALIRWAQGWNQKEAALACHVPHATWRFWELRNKAPRDIMEVAGKISAATGYSDYWIMTGRQDPRQGDPDGGQRLPHLDSNQEHTGSVTNLVRADFGHPFVGDLAA